MPFNEEQCGGRRSFQIKKFNTSEFKTECAPMTYAKNAYMGRYYVYHAKEIIFLQGSYIKIKF